MNRISFSAQKQDKSPRIVLTADETMMSKYRWGIFVGFSTCMPRGIIPDWFFFSVWSPPGQTKSNRAVYADLKGTRSLLVPMKRGESPTERTEVSKWLNPDIPDLKNFGMDEVR